MVFNRFFSDIVLQTTPGDVKEHEDVASVMVNNVDNMAQDDADHSSAVHNEKRIL